MTGLSSAQLTRLLAQYRRSCDVHDRSSKLLAKPFKRR